MTLLFALIIATLPILAWGYMVSYIRNDRTTVKEFLVGIMAGIGAFSLIYLSGKVALMPQWKSLSLFEQVANGGSVIHGVLAGVITLSALIMTTLTLRRLLRWDKAGERLAILAIIFVSMGALIGILYSIESFRESAALSRASITPLRLGIWSFTSLIAIAWAYLVVALTEECVKFFVSQSGGISLKHQLTVAAFVALGLSGAENILYLVQAVSGNTLISGGIMRGIFSVALHVGATVLIVRGVHLWGAKGLLLWPLFGILLHTAFDLSLSGGYTIVLFITLGITYVALTKPLS